MGALVALATVLVLALGRGEESAADVTAQRGDVSACTALQGDEARACYAREVGLELAAIGPGGGAAPTALAAPVDGTVSFASEQDTSAALLCDLHIRVGATDANKASWTEWVSQ